MKNLHRFFKNRWDKNLINDYVTVYYHREALKIIIEKNSYHKYKNN